MTYSKRHFVLVVAYLYILLFVYAAVSKLLDFETFTVQLAQSPLLSAYAGIIAWLVPGLEILISIFLMIPRYRRVALYASFFLMVMFTTYIVIILNFSDFIPCSCGGVLEKLGWTEHLIFNIVFIGLAAVAILLSKPWLTKRKLLALVILAVVGMGVVALLFAFSEKKMQRNNAFIRRYPHHPIINKDTIDLGYNSFFFAGARDNSTIYLGNFTAPLNVLRISENSEDTISYRIDLPKDNYVYRYPQIRILNDLFYLFDGTIPIIHVGSIKDWKVRATYHPQAYFAFAEPVIDSAVVIRSVSTLTGNNVLGTIELDSVSEVTIHSHALSDTLDGYFYSEGQLIFNKQINKIIYVYYYKNKYLSFSSDFSNYRLLKTIDTINFPQIDVKELSTSNEVHIGGKSIIVNRLSSTYGKYLFINSNRLGRFEPEQILDKASIIDVYNITTNTYQFSFYLYRHNSEKLRSFKVYGNTLYALIGNKLYIYTIKKGFITPNE